MHSLTTLPRKLARASAWVAIVLLMACSVSVDSEGETQTTALIDRLPAGATAIAWVDIEALAEAMPPEEWDEYEEMFQDDEDMQDLERFAEATGMDPREDMKQITFAVMPGDGEEDDYVMLMSAAFDRDKLEGLADGAETISYEGMTFYSAEDVFRNLEEAVGPMGTEDPDGNSEIEVSVDRPGYLAILDGETLAMGTESTLRVIVDVAANRHDALKMDPAMNDLISDVAGQGQIWFVATRDTWDERLDDLAQGGSMVPVSAIESIEILTMSLRMGDGMTMRIAGMTATAEAATELSTSLNGLLALGRMMLQQQEPELFAIIDRGLSVGQDDRTVHIEATLTDADIEILQRMAEEQMPGSVVGSGS